MTLPGFATSTAAWSSAIVPTVVVGAGHSIAVVVAAAPGVAGPTPVRRSAERAAVARALITVNVLVVRSEEMTPTKVVHSSDRLGCTGCECARARRRVTAVALAGRADPATKWATRGRHAAGHLSLEVHQRTWWQIPLGGRPRRGMPGDGRRPGEPRGSCHDVGDTRTTRRSTPLARGSPAQLVADSARRTARGEECRVTAVAPEGRADPATKWATRGRHTAGHLSLEALQRTWWQIPLGGRPAGGQRCRHWRHDGGNGSRPRREKSAV